MNNIPKAQANIKVIKLIFAHKTNKKAKTRQHKNHSKPHCKLTSHKQTTRPEKYTKQHIVVLRYEDFMEKNDES